MKIKSFIAILMAATAVHLAGAGYAADQRLSVAVLDFESMGTEAYLGKAISEIMRTALVSYGNYRVVERSQISKVLAEQKFQRSGIIDDKSAIALGKVLGADHIVVGSVVKIGNAYTINSRMIDVKTGEAKLGKNVTCTDLNLLTGMSQSLIESLFSVPEKREAAVPRKQWGAGGKTVPVPTKGLIAHWFDKSCTAEDRSGHGRNATIKGSPKCLKTPSGSTLRLVSDGSSTGDRGDHIVLPAIAFSSLPQFTVSLLVKEELANHDGEAYIFFGNHDQGWLGIAHFWDSIDFSVGAVGPNSSLPPVAPISIPFKSIDPRKPVHYGLVYDSGDLSAYINGRLVAKKTQFVRISGDRAYLAAHAWIYGEQSNMSTRFTGAIEDVRIYSRALNDDEMRILQDDQ